MSRLPSGPSEQLVRPTNNIYTVLTVIATLVNIIGFIIIFSHYSVIFGPSANLFAH